jgi:hypothetical protein
MTAREFAARFPGVAVWFGQHTRRWWALPPAGDRLVEAATIDELAGYLSAWFFPSGAALVPQGWYPGPVR